MPTSIWLFKQTDYVKKHGLVGQEEGVCLALSARWAKMRLKGRNGSQEVQDRYFDKGHRSGKADVHTIISEMQTAYERVQLPAQARGLEITKEVKAAFDDWMGDVISRTEYFALDDSLKNEGRQLMADVGNAAEQLLARQKLRVVATSTCNSFQEYFDGVKDGSCYVYRCSDIRHAFGAFFVKRPIWDDYYLFDANGAEVHLDGRSEMQQFTTAMKQLFQVEGHSTRYEVVYDGS